MIYLSPKFWAAVALASVLAASHWWMYSLGKDKIRAQWEKDIAQRTTKALEAERAAREREQHLVAERQKVEETYAKQKDQAAASAANARAELNRLRNKLRAAGSAAGKNPATPGRANAAAATPELFGQCASALVDLGAEADRIKGIAGGLQDYVKNVCKP